MSADISDIERLIVGELELVRVGPTYEDRNRIVFPGAFNPFHDGHRQMASIGANLLSAPVEYEISIINVDKQPLSDDEVQRRVKQFRDEQAVWITRAATFVEKARLFPKSTFIVGADTIERIADSKYYCDVASRDSAIDEIADADCRFLVFGRQVATTFVTLSTINLPESLAKICSDVPESEFRSDVSSTSIRTGNVESSQ